MQIGMGCVAAISSVCSKQIFFPLGYKRKELKISALNNRAKYLIIFFTLWDTASGLPNFSGVENRGAVKNVKSMSKINDVWFS